MAEEVLSVGIASYTIPMNLSTLVAAGLLLVGSVALAQEQEKKVPSDSARITISGCARNGSLIVRWRPDHETVSQVAEGRRFRLSGNKQMIKDIGARERMMVEVTGLVRRSDLSGPGGVTIGNGRVRIGGGAPQASMGDPARSSGYNQAVLDMESWTPLPDSCPER